jgi:hypothetical protein
MEQKKCKKCQINKELTEFNKGNDPKDGKNYVCKECQKIINKKYNDNNKDKHKEWVKNNPEKVKEKSKRFYNKNKDNRFSNMTEQDKIKYKEKRANYYQANKDAIKNSVKIYSNNNKEKILLRHNNYKKDGKTKIYRDKIKHIIAWRNILNSTIKRLGGIKEGNTIDLLGYSGLDLKEYISNLFTDGMTWDNYGEWHIDHIKPVNTFSFDTPINVVNSLSNLRPLWATTRIINGVIYEGNLNRPKYF